MKLSGFVSKFLTADDVRTPKLIFISMLTEEEVAREPKVILRGNTPDGDEHKIVMNKTNIEKLIEIFGTDDSDQFIGEAVVVYRDPSIKFNNRAVGGIAFRKPKKDALDKYKAPTLTPANGTAEPDTSFDVDF